MSDILVWPGETHFTLSNVRGFFNDYLAQVSIYLSEGKKLDHAYDSAPCHIDGQFLLLFCLGVVNHFLPFLTDM